MCRNLETLYNFEPPASPDEVRAAALQFVRKVSGLDRPSRVNAEAFDRAVDGVCAVAEQLLADLSTAAPPRDRTVKAENGRARAERRFGSGGRDLARRDGSGRDSSDRDSSDREGARRCGGVGTRGSRPLELRVPACRQRCRTAGTSRAAMPSIPRPSACSIPSALYTDHLPELVHHVDQIALGVHHRVDRLVRCRCLVEHVAILAALDVARGSSVLAQRDLAARL